MVRHSLGKWSWFIWANTRAINKWCLLKECIAEPLCTQIMMGNSANIMSPSDVAAKLMNKSSPMETGSMHSILGVHVGMYVRLLEALDLEKGLVKDAEGEVVHIAVNPLDQAEVDAARAAGQEQIYLRHLPLGFWIKMKKYKAAPICKQLAREDASLVPTLTESLLFLEPRMAKPFMFRGHRVSRTGFACSHGRVVTSTACQGRTMKHGVVLDCGRHEGGTHPKELDDWWLDLYVMLSRATSLNDLLLLRSPPSSFLLRGPPAFLRQQLEIFTSRTEACRISAVELARELGFECLLHD